MIQGFKQKCKQALAEMIFHMLALIQSIIRKGEQLARRHERTGTDGAGKQKDEAYFMR